MVPDGEKPDLMDVKKELLSGSDIFELREKWNEEQVLRIPARTLAYIGDAVFELGLRLSHVRTGMDHAGRLHDSLVKFVSSPAQAKLFEKIFPTVDENEQQFLKNWRNTKLPSRYGSGTKGEYARATALEAWVAYLFLTKQEQRLENLFKLALSKQDHEEKKSA